MSKDRAPIDVESEVVGSGFEELAGEAAEDLSEQPGADQPPAGPPPVDPREVAFMANLLGAVGKMFAPRWLGIIQQGDAEARAAGVDTPGGLMMLSEAIIPVANKYFPDISNSPVINLVLVAGMVLGPCIGEPLRDKPKKEDAPDEPAA